MTKVKLLSERERARYYRITSISPKDRTDLDQEELDELLVKMEREAARNNGRTNKQFVRGVNG